MYIGKADTIHPVWHHPALVAFWEVVDSENEDEKKEEEGKDCDEPKVEKVDEEKEKEEKKQKQTKKVNEFSHVWEQLNKNTPLWMRMSEDVTNEENAYFCNVSF